MVNSNFFRKFALIKLIIYCSFVMTKYLKYIFLIVSVIFFEQPIAANKNKIDRFAEVVDSIHSSFVFPYNIGPGIIITNIGVDKKDQMLVINYTLNPCIIESIIKNVSSENGIAQLLTGYDEIFSISMIEAEAGYKVIITSPSDDGINKTQIVTVPASAITAVYSKLKNGDNSPLKPYLKVLEDSFANMQFPQKIANGVSIINGYVKDKEAHWVYRIEGNIDSSKINDNIIQNNRFNLINNLRSILSPDYLTEIEERGITLHYTYLNDRNDVLFEFVFTANDLK